MQDQLVRKSLLVEQDELLPALHLLSRDREQLLARGDSGTEQLVGERRARHIWGEVRGEEVQPVPAPRAGEQPALASCG